MKKILSLLMITVMCGNGAFAGAAAPNHADLIAKTFNQFRYKMTVDVRPGDTAHQAAVISEFKENMAAIERQGVTGAEIMEYMRSNVLDPAVRSDFDRMLSTMDPEQVSSDEAGNMAMKFMAGKYQQGASYSGGARVGVRTALVVLGVVAVGVATYYLYQYLRGKLNCQTKTSTQTDTITDTDTDTDTDSDTDTDTDTHTHTDTDTDHHGHVLCCNGVSGHIVMAKKNGCDFGAALYEVSSESECVAGGSPIYK